VTETQRQHLGTLLVQANIISASDLAVALKAAEEENKRLGEVLIARGFATEEQIQNFLGIQLGFPSVQLRHTFIDPELARSVPEKFERRFGVLPLYRAETGAKSTIVVGMCDPADIVAQDELRRACGAEIFPVLVSHREMSQFLDRLWNTSEPASLAPESYVRAQVFDATEGEAKPSVARVLETLFNRALGLGAASLHFEPKAQYVAVRFKIDGEYFPVTSLPRDVYAAVLSRVKILARIELAETVAHVTEGRFHLRASLPGPLIDILVTLIPAVYGEKAVLKITRRDSIMRPIELLGFEPEQLSAVRALLRNESGLVLITGKHDSGMTTLAYSLLAALENASRMVVTIEDRPAYPVSSFNQIIKTDSAGQSRLSWEETLRAVERQEPHIVYLAGAHSLDEARIFLRLASTGRFVLSTLYADDATSAYWVPFQMGVDPHALASALSCVIHCRLLRRLCDACKRPAPAPTPDLAAALGVPAASLKGKTFFEKVGCEKCGGDGYSGRIGVFELLQVHDHLKELIASRTSSSVFRQAACESGMMTLKESALAKAERGVVSIEEIIARLR